eukprot:g16341.t1
MASHLWWTLPAIHATGALNGTVPDCVKLPVYASVAGRLDLQVGNPSEFVKDENAKRGIKKSIAQMCEVNESDVNVTLEVVNTSANVTDTTVSPFPDRRLAFLEVARRLQELVVRVDYVVTTEVADESTAVSRGTEMLTALTLPTDEQFAQSITQAIEEASEGNSSYSVTVTARQANIQVVIGDEVFEAPPVEVTTTKLPLIRSDSILRLHELREAPPGPDYMDAGTIAGITIAFITLLSCGLCVGLYCGRFYIRRRERGGDRKQRRERMKPEGETGLDPDDEGRNAPDVEESEQSESSSSLPTPEDHPQADPSRQSRDSNEADPSRQSRDSNEAGPSRPSRPSQTSSVDVVTAI